MNHFNFIDKYEQAFKEMRTDIQEYVYINRSDVSTFFNFFNLFSRHRFFSESFYEYQKAIKELSQNLKKLRSIRHQVIK